MKKYIIVLGAFASMAIASNTVNAEVYMQLSGPCKTKSNLARIGSSALGPYRSISSCENRWKNFENKEVLDLKMKCGGDNNFIANEYICKDFANYDEALKSL